ncbi:PAXNEB protein-domain-containing protein [Amylostereum chailletii]|nr:PAXNEB protein-domain-containing protein [Amylostereum chailletii]
MSAFKRRSAVKPTSQPIGTRPSPSSPSTIITSTGIPSLDDILGGGLPLSCSLLILAPDPHSAYGELVQKYFLAQGLASGQTVCVIDPEAQSIVTECMWTPGSGAVSPRSDEVDEDEDKEPGTDSKVKIAWRYEQMKKFQTTVTASNSSTEEFCRTFDLTCRIPRPVIDAAMTASKLVCPALPEANTGSYMFEVVKKITEVIKSSGSSPIRVCVPALGSPSWGDLTSQAILRFLHSLRCILRAHPHVCASVSLAPHLSTEDWGGHGWAHKLSWLSDAAITLNSFTADPSLSALFPSYHGLLRIHTLPAPHTLQPPSDRFSTLRGLASSSGSAGGGENNLAFKCMRKRLVLETMHLDVEGGVGERRTTPANGSVLGDGSRQEGSMAEGSTKRKPGVAAVEVKLEGMDTGGTKAGIVGLEAKEVGENENENENESGTAVVAGKAKKKKTVGFRTERPDVYDF